MRHDCHILAEKNAVSIKELRKPRYVLPNFFAVDINREDTDYIVLFIKDVLYNGDNRISCAKIRIGRRIPYCPAAAHRRLIPGLPLRNESGAGV